MTLLRSAIAYQNGGKNVGKTNCGNEELRPGSNVELFIYRTYLLIRVDPNN